MRLLILIPVLALNLAFPSIAQKGDTAAERLNAIKSHNLNPEETLFQDYDTKFVNLEKTFPDDYTLGVYEDTAYLASISMLDADLAVDMYDRIYCESDRKNVRPVLKSLLDFYTLRIDHGAARVSMLALMAKTPGDVDLATRFHDDLIAAKTKLDKISASI